MHGRMSSTVRPLTLVRVPRGAPRPSDETLRSALAEDRRRLGLLPSDGGEELVVTGPFPIELNGQALDEWVVWER